MAVFQDSATVLIEDEFHKLLSELESKFNADCLGFFGPIINHADDLVREAVEARATRRPNLVVLLETDGGYIQVVERIVRVFRNYYGRVEFVVPNYAMSAGTVLAMSGDAIHMDYYSVLGPIDPQLPKPNGPGMVPALGYLAEYNRLVKKSAAGGLTSAEVAYFIEKFDPGEMHDFKQARALSVTLLTNWLVQYKFKDWAETETNKTPVTQEIKEERAKSIAKALNKTTLWHSHGRGIPMVVLEDKLKLKIDDLAENPERYKCVEKYSNLLKHYMVKSGNEFALHTPGRYSCF